MGDLAHLALVAGFAREVGVLLTWIRLDFVLRFVGTISEIVPFLSTMTIGTEDGGQIILYPSPKVSRDPSLGVRRPLPKVHVASFEIVFCPS